MTQQFQRRIFIYGNYFRDFYNKQSKTVQKKIDYKIEILQQTKVIPEKTLKPIKGFKGLYEIVVNREGKNFRIFCFFDNETLIILMIGSQKRLSIQGKNEIEKANKLRKEYYFEKGKGVQANGI